MTEGERYILTSSLREELKKPLGVFISDLTELKAGGIVVCVGDETCDRVLSYGIEPKACVYDNKVGRKDITLKDSIKEFKAEAVELKNPPGTLTQKAFEVLAEAFTKQDNTKIFVDGEEDLITLAAISAAPQDSAVLYGQPGEGLVCVSVNEEIKEKVKKILEEMKHENQRG